jgi:hypothetical protein
MNLTTDEAVRFEELESKAKEEFLSNCDFLPKDWLDEEEGEEYNRLFNKLFDVRDDD